MYRTENKHDFLIPVVLKDTTFVYTTVNTGVGVSVVLREFVRIGFPRRMLRSLIWRKEKSCRSQWIRLVSAPLTAVNWREQKIPSLMIILCSSSGYILLVYYSINVMHIVHGII